LYGKNIEFLVKCCSILKSESLLKQWYPQSPFFFFKPRIQNSWKGEISGYIMKNVFAGNFRFSRQPELKIISRLFLGFIFFWNQYLNVCKYWHYLKICLILRVSACNKWWITSKSIFWQQVGASQLVWGKLRQLMLFL